MPDKRVYANEALESTRKLTYKWVIFLSIGIYQPFLLMRKGHQELSPICRKMLLKLLKGRPRTQPKDASGLAEYLNKAKNPDPNAGLGAKAGAVVLEAAIPFTKTPINLIKRGIQYSPVSIVNGLNMMAKK